MARLVPHLDKRMLLAFLAAATCTTHTWAQNKLHVDIDHHFHLGISEHVVGTKMTREENRLNAFGLLVSTRFDVSTRWSVGVGAGVVGYTEPDHSTIPIFATVRYKAIPKVPEAYLFTDLGSSIRAAHFTKGFTGRWGIGYTYMFSKRFGLNFQLAYHLKRFDNILIYVYNESTQEYMYALDNTTRHSLSFGIGLTF